MRPAQLAHQNCRGGLKNGEFGKGLFLDARALPSRTRDLPHSRQNGGGAGRLSPPRPFRPLRRRSGRIAAEPYPPLRCCQYRPTPITIARIYCRNELRQGITRLVLLRFRWPGLKCPSLAGFQVSPEERWALQRFEALPGHIIMLKPKHLMPHMPSIGKQLKESTEAVLMSSLHLGKMRAQSRRTKKK
jgi:hypothetical protein